MKGTWPGGLRSALATCVAAALVLLPAAARAQGGARVGATVTGRVLESETGVPILLAHVAVEGTEIETLTDSGGAYRLEGVPPGPQVLVVDRLGYATSRVPITVPVHGTLTREIRMATQALEVEGLIVTATPSGRAKGELGTASVVDREAIANQSASSLAGVLELVPGVPLQPPGLDDVQQIGLRSVPTASTATITQGGPSAGDLASLGTTVILDGVPLSNNANLQTTGPRGEVRLPTSAGGGIDLRRIPASTIERVEVIRGVPSARYGDLTQGAIIVETRAGRVEPAARARYDVRLFEGSLVGGTALGGGPQTASGVFDVSNNQVSPGLNDDNSVRVTGQLAHRAEAGIDPDHPLQPRFSLDSRLDFFQVEANNPEQPAVKPGTASGNRDRGLRISERGNLALGGGKSLGVTAALDYTQRRSFDQALRLRGGTPFTDRLTEGRAVGRYLTGEYLSRLDVDGNEWQLFTRTEGEDRFRRLGFDQRARAGLVLRREWNTGPGFQFDIARPPQVTFNGVQGFDRPRPFDRIPALTTSALYLDDRLVRALPGDMSLDVQAGLRLDLLHDGSTWFSGVRDAVLEPRLNVQLSPWSWLRLRAGWGRTAKEPTVAQLFPAPQYFDVVNVNFFANDPAERLAVLTTFIRDPTNPDLGYARARKAEAGIELSPGAGTSIGLVAFDDRTTGGVGFHERPGFLLRDRFQLTDSVPDNGVPAQIIEPPFTSDTVPILVDEPSNNLTLESKGLELTASLPEVRPLHTRLDVEGAWVRTRFFKSGLDFGTGFSEFQLNENFSRSPFWEDPIRKGERAVFTYRLVHHQPALGLVVTATVEQFAFEKEQNVAGTDSLAFAGYITRAGKLVRVPRKDRTKSEFEDLRQPRLGTFTVPEETPADWLMSLQVSKTLPEGGRLSFFAFNVLDRRGRIAESGIARRFFPFVRFGVEATLPLGTLF